MPTKLSTPLSECVKCGNKCCKEVIGDKIQSCSRLNKDGTCKDFDKMRDICKNWICDHDYFTGKKLEDYYGIGR